MEQLAATSRWSLWRAAASPQPAPQPALKDSDTGSGDAPAAQNGSIASPAQSSPATTLSSKRAQSRTALMHARKSSDHDSDGQNATAERGQTVGPTPAAGASPATATVAAAAASLAAAARVPQAQTGTVRVVVLEDTGSSARLEVVCDGFTGSLVLCLDGTGGAGAVNATVVPRPSNVGDELAGPLASRTKSACTSSGDQDDARTGLTYSSPTAPTSLFADGRSAGPDAAAVRASALDGPAAPLHMPDDADEDTALPPNLPLSEAVDLPSQPVPPPAASAVSKRPRGERPRQGRSRDAVSIATSEGAARRRAPDAMSEPADPTMSPISTPDWLKREPTPAEPDEPDALQIAPPGRAPQRAADLPPPQIDEDELDQAVQDAMAYALSKSATSQPAPPAPPVPVTTGKRVRSGSARVKAEKSAIGRSTRHAVTLPLSPAGPSLARAPLDDVVEDELGQITLPAPEDADVGGCCRAVVGLTWHHAVVAGATPPGRWGHVAAAGSAEVYVCGGESDDSTLGDVCRFEPGRGWHSTAVDGLAARKWAASVYNASARMLLIHGGECDNMDAAATTSAAEDSADSKMDDCLMALDTDIMVAYPPAVSGKGPGWRSGHSMCIVTDEVSRQKLGIVFGGIRGRSWLNDVYALNLSTYRWQAVRASARGPAPRSYHCAVGMGKYMIVFGGNNGDKSFDDVYVLDCTPGFTNPADTAEASANPADGLLALTESASTWTWSKPAIVGAGPCPRTGATAVALGPRFVLISGGWDPDQNHSASARSARRSRADDSAAVLAGNTTPAPEPATAASSSRRRRTLPVSPGTAPTLRSSPRRHDADASGPRPFADSFILDTHSWEWFRVADDFAAGQGNSGDPPHIDEFAGRVGATTVFVEDVTPYVTSSPTNADATAATSPEPRKRARQVAIGATPGQARTSPAEITAKQLRAGVVFFGGLKANGSRHADIAVLTLPDVLRR